MDLNLKHLLQESRQLTNHVLPTGLTPLDRGLEQIEAQTKRFVKRNAAKDSSKTLDSRTAYLLASRGIDTDKVLENLTDINLGLTFEPLQAVPDTDIDLYLRNEHETLVSLAIEESRNQTIVDFESNFEQSLQRDWARQKRKIMENMGKHSLSHIDMDQGESDLGMRLKNQSAGMVSQGDLNTNPRLKAYAAVVKELNDARLKQQPFNAISSFRKASSKNITDRQHEFICTLWDLFAKMLGIHKGNAGALFSGNFSKVYAQYCKHEMNQETNKFRNTMVKGAREWLQESFRNHVSKHVRDQHFEIGGMPSVHDEIDAYLKLSFFSNGRWSLAWLDQTIGRVPFWAHVYMLVRMGLLKEALDYIQKYSNELSVTKDMNFLAYFRAWVNAPDGRLPKPLRDSLIGEWNARIRDYITNQKSTPKGDAFKYALYKMIGRCELNVKTIRNNHVICNTEDYVWFQTILISEDIYTTDPAFERFTLSDFSQSMQKFGKDYFQKIETWFMVLLCCGEFEKAVNELANEPFFAEDALHFSIAMAYYGVLKIPDNPRSLPLANTLLSTDVIKVDSVEYTCYSFHFARMIALLVRDWLHSNPVEMMHYIFLIGIFGKPLDVSTDNGLQKDQDPGKEYTRYIYALVKDILTQIDATILIGQLREDGQGRVPGPLEQYRSLIHLNSEQEFLDRIILSAAEQCDREGRLKDALELYNLSCQPNKVLELLIRQIGEMLLANAANTKDGPFENQNPVETAIRVIDYYMSRSFEASVLNAHTVYTCRTLITLANFRKEAEVGHIESALSHFYSLEIVPSTNDMAIIQKKASSFNSLDESICRVIPPTLVMVATLLSTSYQQITQSRSAERESRLQSLKQRMKAILTFCGMIQYQIPGDMIAKINRLDVMMV